MFEGLTVAIATALCVQGTLGLNEEGEEGHQGGKEGALDHDHCEKG